MYIFMKSRKVEMCTPLAREALRPNLRPNLCVHKHVYMHQFVGHPPAKTDFASYVRPNFVTKHCIYAHIGLRTQNHPVTPY